MLDATKPRHRHAPAVRGHPQARAAARSRCRRPLQLQICSLDYNSYVGRIGIGRIFKVSGRGTLHLGILIENMRREGFEFAVGKPRPIYREINGKKAEPIEILVVDVPQQHAGKVIEVLGPRRGEVAVMDTKNNLTHLEFHVPSRGLIGLRTHLLTLTQGEAIIHHSFYQYEFFKGSIPHRINGALISMESHPVTFYALEGLQDRGVFFVGPQDEVYVGQIVGEHCKPGDLTINVGREKKLTNMRSAGAEKNVRLAPPRVFALEEALEYIDDDELVEVTPDSIRLRKRLLDENDRKKAKRVGGGDDLVLENEGA
jgi:GTP-binding protein